MNSNRRIVIFVLSTFALYLLFSVVISLLPSSITTVQRINLISDVVIKDTVAVEKTNTATAGLPASTASEPEPEKLPLKNFALYRQPHFVTNFNADTSLPSLQRFVQKLAALQKNKKGKVRIAYFGDSMIEGDLLTQTFRKLFQQAFGGSGAGFVPVSCPTSKFRQTVTDNYSGGWQEVNFKSTGKKDKLFLSGYMFTGSNEWVEMRDRTVKDSNALVEMYLYYGYADGTAKVKVNGMDMAVPPADNFGKLLLSKSKTPYVKLYSSDSQLPIYGISFETASGVIVDNFSFRGISGVEFATIDSAFLNAVASENKYDLLIFQYGVNVLYRPNDTNFSWYARMLKPVVKKIRKSFPESDLLIVSTADRAFRYGDEYRSAIGIDSLIKVQAAIAYETGAGFYNQFATMGGHNSIVEWANAKPALANKDYVHPNAKGADILAEHFFNAIMRDYHKYINQNSN
jgi:lysophospholipase L1-like esterase